MASTVSHHGHLIDGHFVAGDEFSENRNPSNTDDLIGLYARGQQKDVDAAIAAAAEAFTKWSSTRPAERSAALQRISVGITAREAELADMLAREEGKTLAEATGEVKRAAATFSYYAGEILHAQGAVYQSLATPASIQTVHRPVGVVGIITPWNFPIAIPAWKAAPALAYGNTVVLKPAELTPGTSWLLAEIIHQSGLPNGVFNFVMGSGRLIGTRLTESPLVKAITFTGSSSVGKSVANSAVEHGLKKVQLEMGGKNPLIVMDDADINTAVAAAADGAFGSTGQRCTASSRLVVHDTIHDRFVDALVARMQSIIVGDARASDTTMGPVVSESELQQDLDYIALGQREGGNLAFGGTTLEAETSGYYLQPTLLTDTDNSWRLNQEEIFGPVASVIRVHDYEEAIHVANDVDYGLSAGIITTSLARAHDFAARSRAGILSVNRSTAGTDLHVPFGGNRASSYGSREQGTAARSFFTTTASIYTNPGEV